MRSNFVTIAVEVLNLRIICPLVRNIECASNGTSVRVSTVLLKKTLVDGAIEVVDGVVEGKNDHLWYVLW